MINYLEIKQTLIDIIYKSHPGQVLVERIETNKHGTTYHHKHWVNPEDVNSKTDKILIDNSKPLSDEEYSKKVEGDYQTWLSALPKVQVDDLNSYTSHRYMYINGYKRSTLKNPLPNDELKRVKSEISGIVQALNSSTVTKPITVYRRMEKEWLPRFKQLHDSGKLFEDKGFMSTTIIRGSFKGNDENGVPLNHLNENNGFVEMIIHVPKGKGIGGYIRPISDYSSEFEFLLNCNSRFSIRRIEQDKNNPNVHYIHMDVVGRQANDKDVKYV